MRLPYEVRTGLPAYALVELILRIGSNSAVWASTSHAGGPRQGEIGSEEAAAPVCPGESTKGTAPSAARRSGRKTLDLSGSHHSTLSGKPCFPVCDEFWLFLTHLPHNLRRLDLASSQALVFRLRPTNQIFVNLLERIFLFPATKLYMVVDPPSYYRVDLSGYRTQSRPTPQVYSPSAYVLPY